MIAELDFDNLKAASNAILSKALQDATAHARTYYGYGIIAIITADWLQTAQGCTDDLRPLMDVIEGEPTEAAREAMGNLTGY
jgi:hypothetical protein